MLDIILYAYYNIDVNKKMSSFFIGGRKDELLCNN